LHLISCKHLDIAKINGVIMEKHELHYAKPEEASELFNMYLKKARWFKEKGIDQWDEVYIREYINESRILQLIEEKNYFVLKKDGEIEAGCILNDDCSKWPKKEENCKYIDYLVSCKANAGRILIEKLIEHCKQLNVQKLKLDCQNHNEKLRKYYYELHFEDAGVVAHKYYPNRYSCLLSLNITQKDI